MEEVYLWLSVLLDQWRTMLAGGGIVGFFFIVLLVAERMTGWTMPKLWFALLAIFFVILVAAFQAWKAEHQKWNQLTELNHELERERDRSKPKLKGEIDVVAYTSVGTNNENSVVIVLAMITNTGAPSIARDFEILIKVGDTEIKGISIAIPKNGIIMYKNAKGEGVEMAIKSEDYLPKKAVSNPIPDGGCVYGFLYEYFPNIVRDKISSGDIYVKFRDVAGTEYRTKWLAKSEQDFENNIIFDLNKLKQN